VKSAPVTGLQQNTPQIVSCQPAAASWLFDGSNGTESESEDCDLHYKVLIHMQMDRQKYRWIKFY